MTDPINSMRLRDEADVMPEAAPYLRLGSGLDSYAWGWSERETGLPPPEGGSFARGLLWGLPIAVALWAALLWLLYAALRWWR